MFQTSTKSYSAEANNCSSINHFNLDNIEPKNMSNLNNFLSIQNFNDSNQTINSIGGRSSVSTASSSFLNSNETSLTMNGSGINSGVPHHKYSFSSDISNNNGYFNQQSSILSSSNAASNSNLTSDSESNSNLYVDYLTSNPLLDPNSTPTVTANSSSNILNNNNISSIAPSSTNHGFSNYKYSSIFQPNKKADNDLSKLKISNDSFVSQFNHANDSASNVNTPISSCFDNQSITYSSSMLSPKAPPFFPSNINANNNNIAKPRNGRNSISSNSYTSSSLKPSGSMPFTVNSADTDPKFNLSNSMSNLSVTNGNVSANFGSINDQNYQLASQQNIESSGNIHSLPSNAAAKMDLKIMQTQFEQLQKQYNKLQELIEIKNNKNELFRDSKNNFSLQIEIPNRLALILEKLLATLNSKEGELNDTKDRLEALISTVALNPNKSMTNFGQYDEQEICHKFVTRLRTLSEENMEMGKLLQFGKTREKDIELGILKLENTKLKKKIKFLEESITK